MKVSCYFHAIAVLIPGCSSHVVARGKILVCLWIRSCSMIMCVGVVRMCKEADLLNVKVLQQQWEM